MKKTRQCPKCDSLKIGFLPNALPELLQEDPVSPRHEEDPPQRLNPIEQMLAQSRIVDRLEAFICTDCGFYEMYLGHPESMRFEQVDGFRWLNAAQGANPYR